MGAFPVRRGGFASDIPGRSVAPGRDPFVFRIGMRPAVAEGALGPESGAQARWRAKVASIRPQAFSAWTLSYTGESIVHQPCWAG